MKFLITILIALCLGIAPSNDDIKYDSVLCELEPIGNVSYSVVQKNNKYYISGSNGSLQHISFENAVNHCCEYGAGSDGCDWPPQPGSAKSFYVDQITKIK